MSEVLLCCSCSQCAFHRHETQTLPLVDARAHLFTAHFGTCSCFGSTRSTCSCSTSIVKFSVQNCGSMRGCFGQTVHSLDTRCVTPPLFEITRNHTPRVTNTPSQVKSIHKQENNRQPYGSLSNVLRKPAGEDGSRWRWRRGT